MTPRQPTCSAVAAYVAADEAWDIEEGTDEEGLRWVVVRHACPNCGRMGGFKELVDYLCLPPCEANRYPNPSVDCAVALAALNVVLATGRFGDCAECCEDDTCRGDEDAARAAIEAFWEAVRSGTCV